MPERTTDAAASEPQEPTPGSQVPTDASDGAASKAPPPAGSPETGSASTEEGNGSRASQSQMPEYKGEPLDAERGPGLGCFWIQIALLTFFLVFTPLTVTWGWPPIVSAALLILTLILLLFSGQTVIFLLRLVAADRRTRRAPLSPRAKPTVGQMEDAGADQAATPPSETTDAEAPPGAAGTSDPGGEQEQGDR